MDVRKFFIKPAIPEKISRLQDLAFNLWSCWDKDAERLFHRLDPQLFRKLNHNPIELLYNLPAERLDEMAGDEGFLYELNQAYDKFQRYMRFEGSYVASGEDRLFSKDDVIAYLCMEYGLHESVPSYSGGLAVLAGDTLKAASDIGIPMVSFGLLYRHGYFNQHITSEGNQVEEFRENTWYLSAVQEIMDSNGNPLIIGIPLKGETVHAKIWKIAVGRVPLYMLDTNIHQNPPKIRAITNMLYDSDRKTRFEQELVLGRGTIIAMKALGIAPKIYHLNEGHTAFSIVERLLDLTKDNKYSLEEATALIRYSTVFTSHTPIEAGNENFPEEFVQEYLEDEVEALGLTMKEFLEWGKISKDKNFLLPALAMRFSRRSNGVSDIHAMVSRKMWKNLFPMVHDKEIPIDGVTNGVHLQSWLSLQMTEIFNRYIGPDYMHKAENPELWEKIDAIPDGEIWNAHRRRKEQLVSFIRRRVGDMMSRRGYCKNKIKDVSSVLNPDHLTIGFARRFTQYKRAELILRDPERLVAILTNEEKPVQIVFAGKAHPADGIGKGLIKQIINFINDYPVENHVVFIEDYDINVARHLVQGVDVWLNTPRPPLEASGTSGMKAGINGVLNLSVLDGWWPEAYNGDNGWAINAGEHGETEEIRDEAEANQLYELLENEVTKFYYDRTESDLPVEWVKMMKSSITTCNRSFNMHRAMREYLYRFYLPQMDMFEKLNAENGSILRKLSAQRKEIDVIWPIVYIRDFFTSINGRLPVTGEKIEVDCYVYLGDASENLINAEIFYCYGSGMQQFKTIPLNYVERYRDKVAKYTGSFYLEGIGLQDMCVRITPSDPDLREVYPHYIKWKE